MATSEQIERNERLYREVNEHISDLSEDLLAGGADLIDFFCECGRQHCADRVQLTLTDYRRVRADEGRFLVAPHHEIEPPERVVERHERYTVVEKPWLEE